MSLPVDGQTPWGDQLNADILADETQITQNTTNISNHTNNIPADPHGDRAYTDQRLLPITTGINGPNGYVVNGPNGKIPLSCIPVGAGLTNWIDVVPDFNVPINGVSDAAPSLNAALLQTQQAGGGIVYVGNGEFALGESLIIGANTWLICSPAAIFTRINTGGPSSPCFSMVRNYGPATTPGSNIRITGGTWDVALSGHNGTMFTFAAADFIVIDNLTVAGQPDGFSPIGRLFGCANVILDNIEIISLAPTVTGRSNQHRPCFQFEECNTSNNTTFCVNELIPTAFISSQACSDIKVRGCVNRCGTLDDDNLGAYGAWTSFCGTVGTVTSGSIHANIVITQCFGTGFANANLEVINWSNLTCTGNFFSYSQYPYVASWVGVSAQVQTFIFDTNTPRCYSPIVTSTCGNTLTETIVAQFTIAANDYINGSSCYEHRHSGIITTATATETLTFKVYVGPNGNVTDTLTESFTLTLNQAVTNYPYCIHHRGYDIDPDGHWNPCGTEFKSQCYHWDDNNGTRHHGYEHVPDNTGRCQPNRNVQNYVTHTVTWGAAKASNTISCRTGYHDRRRV